MAGGSRFWSLLRAFGRRLPYFRDIHRYVRALEAEREQLRIELAHWRTWMSPGHFYSPIPSLQEVAAHDAEIFAPPPAELSAIDLRVPAQLELLAKLSSYYLDLPFPRSRNEQM